MNKLLFALSMSLIYLTFSKVKIEVFTESLCPDCHDFALSSFSKYYAFNRFDLADVEYVPFGNAQEKKVGNKWEFTCQHGANECYGNIIDTCAIHELGVVPSYPFLICMHSKINTFKKNFDKTLEACMTDTAVRGRISECAKGDLGNKLEHEMAQRTPKHNYVPYISVNGVHDVDAENLILKDLVGYVCSLPESDCINAK